MENVVVYDVKDADLASFLLALDSFLSIRKPGKVV